MSTTTGPARETATEQATTTAQTQTGSATIKPAALTKRVKRARKMPVDRVKKKLSYYFGMPRKSCTVAGQRFYKLPQVAKHFSVSVWSLRKLCIDGVIESIHHPALRNGERLIPESELRRVLTESF
jgi:hypothetical protein